MPAKKAADPAPEATDASIVDDATVQTDELQADVAADPTAATVTELNARPIPMQHPDGGTCDLYKQDKAGNILVPASEAALMIEHGFIVVDDA